MRVLYRVRKAGGTEVCYEGSSLEEAQKDQSYWDTKECDEYYGGNWDRFYDDGDSGYVVEQCVKFDSDGEPVDWDGV